MARRSPHIVSHDLHEVEEHTEKDVIPKKDMYRTFGSQHGYGLSDRNHEKHNILGMSEF